MMAVWRVIMHHAQSGMMQNAHVQIVQQETVLATTAHAVTSPLVKRNLATVNLVTSHGAIVLMVINQRVTVRALIVQQGNARCLNAQQVIARVASAQREIAHNLIARQATVHRVRTHRVSASLANANLVAVAKLVLVSQNHPVPAAASQAGPLNQLAAAKPKT
jgi:tagatose-1,6-bisphosphate aldolase